MSLGTLHELAYGLRPKRDNSNPQMKVSFRRWLLKRFESPKVLDLYGGHGVMHAKVWATADVDYEATKGDVFEWFEAHTALDHDIFDIDPHGSSFEAIAVIGEMASKKRIGFACTDGALRMAGQIRGNIPKILSKRLGWSNKSHAMKQAIFSNYDLMLREAVEACLPGWTITTFVWKHGLKSHHMQWMGYFAFVARRGR